MTCSKHILIATDDNGLAASIVTVLAADDAFQSTTVTSITELYSCIFADDARFGALLLDTATAGERECEVVSYLRRERVDIPIILLGTVRDERGAVSGLEAGANDYIAKPVRLLELKARLRAQLRMHETNENALLAVGPYEFRPALQELFDPTGARRIRLTKKEAELLAFLCRAHSTPVDCGTLLREVWGYSQRARTNTVGTHIYRLRRKIEADPLRTPILLRDKGGYRLNAGWTSGGDDGLAADAPAPLLAAAHARVRGRQPSLIPA
ncbi:response regulator transcription factor [Limobrevibacterium gyesilva]|uniref:Response regulator transcription factor n=1 Tax=Limobrevibacterium gyesilva TaxID=2991712 RepID=A0AA41YK67_9PROT|nr:response regulator transcription factor [Limobrevibacterium gyesilva]MCW3473846.1 response regulator transcription factor [Limobrevibacterium gyesilva]